MRNEDRAVIVSHALETPERSRNALLLHFAFPSIMAGIVKPTLAAIGACVLEALGPGWKLTIAYRSEKEFFLRLRREHWPDGVHLCLEKEKTWPVVWVGVGREPAAVDSPLDSDLHAAMTRGLPSIRPGQRHDSYSWWGNLDRYKSWDSEEGLLELVGRREVVDHLSALLLKMREIAEPILDGAYPRSNQLGNPVTPENARR